MAWVFSRNSKEYKERVKSTHDKYYKLYKSINAKYFLGISDSELWDRAYKYARAEADSHFLVIGDLFNKENWTKALLMIVLTIVAIVGTCFGQLEGWQFYLAIGGQIIGGISGLGLQLAQIDVLNDIKYYEAIINITHISTQKAKKANEAALMQTARLFIFAPYAMFPEGYLYKDENAGEISYRAGLEAPNCMKAINGKKKDNEFAKVLTNRAHTKLAGNDGYDNVKNPFPTSKFEENTKQGKESIAGSIKTHLLAIQKGIGELANNYFCFDDAKALENHFNRNIDERVNVRIKRYNCYMFLKQNTYYQKGIRLPKYEKIDVIAKQKFELPIWHNANFIMIGHKLTFEIKDRMYSWSYSDLLIYKYNPFKLYTWAHYKVRHYIDFKQLYAKLYNKPSGWENVSGGEAWHLYSANLLERIDKNQKHTQNQINKLYTCYYFNQNGEIKASTYALESDMPSYRGEVESPPAHKQVEICKVDSKILLHRVQISPSLPQEVDKQSDEYEEYLLKYWKCFRIEVLGSVEKKDKGEGYKKDLSQEAKALAQKYKLHYEHIFFVPVDEDLREINKLELGEEVKDSERIRELKVKNDMFQSYMLADYIKRDREIREDIQ